MDNRLEGKVAIVTGASSGIGRAMARALIGADCKVTLAARSADKVQALADELGPDALAMPTDVTSEQDVTEMVEQTIARFGALEVLSRYRTAVA